MVFVDCILNAVFYNANNQHKWPSQSSATLFALELSDICSHNDNFCVAPY